MQERSEKIIHEGAADDTITESSQKLERSSQSGDVDFMVAVKK